LRNYGKRAFKEGPGKNEMARFRSRRTRVGSYSEDFVATETLRRELTRAITPMDALSFSAAPANTRPPHFGAHFPATGTDYPLPAMNSALSFDLLSGIYVKRTRFWTTRARERSAPAIAV